VGSNPRTREENELLNLSVPEKETRLCSKLKGHRTSSGFLDKALNRRTEGMILTRGIRQFAMDKGANKGPPVLLNTGVEKMAKKRTPGERDQTRTTCFGGNKEMKKRVW